ncbi:MAG: histidine kinase dimerization/phospho-acceptor domain-containing protein, partial [Acetobacteraceae bacterium]
MRRLVGITAMIVALTIAIVVPAGFALQQVLIETRLLRFKARASAIKVSRFVYAYPTLWQYQGDRVSQVIVLPPEDAVKQTILDLQGDVVLDEGETPAFPTLRAEVPIVVDGAQVGRMIVATTLLPVIMEASLVLVLSWLLAGGAFVAVRWLPVRALDRTLGDLARQRAHFKAALDHMTQALCMLDDTQHVAVVNGRFTAMFGGPDAPSLIGIPVTELVDRLVTDAGVNRSACESVLMGATAATSAIAAMTDGRRINISRSGSQAGLWVATFEDITDRWRAEEAEADRTRALSEARLLREKERAAQETSRAKSLFLATMSHEIRTPLNAVLGLASSLLDGPLDEEQRVVVSTIHDSGESLLRILNDILDYSKLEAGRMELEKVAFSPAEITETLQTVMGPRARAKGLSFHIRVDSSLPVLLVGDPGRLRQVLLNLVSNAVKFTDHGTVTV